LGYRILSLVVLKHFLINFIATIANWQYAGQFGNFLSVLGTLGYYAAYAFIIYETVTGKSSVGSLTFLAGSFRQLSGLMETMLSRFTVVSQGAIYLNDFIDFFEIKPNITQNQNALTFPNPIKRVLCSRM
jgi:ATP-binding cassette subfamily B protein